MSRRVSFLNVLNLRVCKEVHVTIQLITSNCLSSCIYTQKGELFPEENTQVQRCAVESSAELLF